MRGEYCEQGEELGLREREGAREFILTFFLKKAHKGVRFLKNRSPLLLKWLRFFKERIPSLLFP